MVRVSTFLPDSGCNFDHTRHLTFSDVEFIQGGLLLRIKWAKNLQSPVDSFTIPIYGNADTTICPILALRSYLHSCNTVVANTPLFTFYTAPPAV